MGSLGTGYASWLLNLGFSWVCFYDPIEELGVCLYNPYITPTNGCATCACAQKVGIGSSLLGGCPPYVRAPIPWYHDPQSGTYYCLPVTEAVPNNAQCFCEQQGL